jgi:hypothetical protein
MTNHQPVTPTDWQDQLGGVAELMGEDVSWREDEDDDDDDEWEDEDVEVDEDDDDDDEEDNEDDEGEAEEGGEASEALSVVIAPNGAPQIVMGAAEEGGSDADTDETIGEESGELDKASVPAGDPNGGKALTHAELDNILGQMGYEPNSAGFTRIL